MAAVNFTRKKVGSLTLGEKLRKIRNDRRITIGEVSKATKIQIKYLESIESGSYEQLPSEVYVRGFLRGYARFLDVPEEALLRMYDRERSIQKNLGRTESFRFQPRAPIRFHLDISSRTAAIGMVALISLGFFAYLYFEFHSFVSEPRLVIVEPIDGATVKTAELVVSGETDRRATVRINGEETVVGEDGRFAERVLLMPGVNAVSVSSENRFGKERSRTVSVHADIPEQVATAISTEGIVPSSGVSVSIRMMKEATVTVRSDTEVVFSGKLPQGETKIFEAKSELRVASDDGSAMLIRIDEGEEMPLADVRGPTERTFFPETRNLPVPISSEN